VDLTTSMRRLPSGLETRLISFSTLTMPLHFA
jgi:hypothetical protein